MQQEKIKKALREIQGLQETIEAIRSCTPNKDNETILGHDFQTYYVTAWGRISQVDLQMVLRYAYVHNFVRFRDGYLKLDVDLGGENHDRPEAD